MKKRKPYNQMKRYLRERKALLRLHRVAVVTIDPSGRQGLIDWRTCKNIAPGRTIAEAVNTLAREEMIDLLLTSYWDKTEKAKSYLRRLPAGKHRHLFAVNAKDEGFFLIWDAPEKPSVLDKAAFREIAEEARQAGLAARYHVYASIAPYTGSSVEFYKIPDRVLEHIGFNQRQDSFNNESGADA